MKILWAKKSKTKIPGDIIAIQVEKRAQYRGQQDGQGQQKRVLYMTPPEMNDDNKAEGVLEILPDGLVF